MAETCAGMADGESENGSEFDGRHKARWTGKVRTDGVRGNGDRAAVALAGQVWYIASPSCRLASGGMRR